MKHKLGCGLSVRSIFYIGMHAVLLNWLQINDLCLFYSPSITGQMGTYFAMCILFCLGVHSKSVPLFSAKTVMY